MYMESQYEKQRLLSRIKQLELENKQLREELASMKQTSENMISVKLTAEQKISVFRSFFYGRQDVVANRYYSKKTAKYGYGPLCKNDYKATFCLKKEGKKINCILCPNRDFIAYSDELLRAHFTGNKLDNKLIILGIYPLLKDNTCFFLAIDFDGEHWMNDMLSVYNIAVRYGIQPLLERSQSGNGGHLWMFFTEPIKATRARKLGDMLLKETMKVNHHIELSSYDRMFPNQDVLPSKGLGNLIALPLQIDALKKENSVFINEKGQKYANQIGYLSTIQRTSSNEVERIISMDDTEDYFYDDNQLSLTLYADTKYNRELTIYEGSLLHIQKKGLNSLSINMIRRIASMYNPDYYLKQRLHKAIYQTPRILSEFEETDNFISIPRGCKEQLSKVFQGTIIDMIDNTNKGVDIDVSFKGELLELQKEAVNAILHHEMGVLQASAGFGKTILALYIIAQRRYSTLIIVNTKKLLQQWQKRIDAFLEYPKAIKKKDHYIGVYTGNKKNLKGYLDIATISALANSDKLDQLLQPYGMVIIDECHHIPSALFRHVLKHVGASYIYGLSATPNRQDGLEKMMYMYCGPKRFETNKKLIISQRTFHQVLYPHFTNTKLIEIPEQYQSLIDEVATDEIRNFMISKDIIQSFKEGRKIIVLSERISHLQVLYEKSRDISAHVYLMLGNSNQKEREQIEEKITRLSDSENFIILATSKLLGEGFDMPALDTLFLTLPIADKNRIEQYTGRIHRTFTDKIEVQVHDYVDIHIPVLEAMFQKRLNAYYREGYELRKLDNKQSMETIVYHFDDYEKALEIGFAQTEKQIVIHMPSYQLGKIKKHHNLLQKTIQRGIHILIVIKQEALDESCRKYLEGAGCKIIQSENKITASFIIIDKKIVWYGNLNIFARSDQNATIICLDNNSLAQELLSIVV